MKKILVICTQPMENSTSSMIRCRNIINELAIENQIVCYAPYANENSIYYDKQAYLNSGIEVRKYGKKIEVSIGRENGKSKKNILIRILYFIYKKIDLFGSSILLLKYKNEVLNSLEGENYDIHLSFSDPKSAHIFASLIKKNNKNLFYIQQWGDPLVHDITNKSILPVWVKKIIERKLMKNANQIYYVSPLTLNEQRTTFKSEAEKMLFLPTPCEVKEYKNVRKNRIQVGYLGSYNSAARDIMPLYNAACKCKDIDFWFVGDSDIKLEPKSNIRIIERVSQKELAQYVEMSDILICLMNKKGSQIPGKLYNYAGTNKEILVLEDGERGKEITKFFSTYQRYTFVDNNETKIEECLKQYIVNGIPNRTAVEQFKPYYIANALISSK